MTARQGKASNQKEPEWQISRAFVPYEDAMEAMESHVGSMICGDARERVWCLEHPPLYTTGASASKEEVLDAGKTPVFSTMRGGKTTYHGPGQLVVYVMADLRVRGRDVKAHVFRLEEWIIRSLADFGIQGARRQGRIGIWVVREGGREEKIAAIGVRVKKWIAYHGLALNVCPDLERFNGIVPCGLSGYGVASMESLGVEIPMPEVINAFRAHWDEVF